MSETKFTKGKWTAHWNETNKRTHTGRWFLVAPDPKWIGTNMIVDLASTSETSRANAALIAAAPDLYAALEEVLAPLIELLESKYDQGDLQSYENDDRKWVEVLSDIQNTDDVINDGFSDQNDEAVNAYRAAWRALAKARGEA